MSLKSESGTVFSLEISLKRNHVYRRTARAWTDQPNKTGQPRRGAANVFFLLRSLASLKSLKLPVPGMSVQVFGGLSHGGLSQPVIRSFFGEGYIFLQTIPWKSLLPSFAKIMSFPFWMMINWETLETWWKRVNQPCNFLNLIFF